MRLAALTLLLALLVSGTLPTQPLPSLPRHFGELNGTFVLFNGTTGEYIRHNPTRAAQRFAPCSTFKIPNTAILLETGVAPDPTFALKCDPALKQPGNWARDFDLTGAFRASALWYFQELSRRVGLAAERRFLERFRYGNVDLSGGMDRVGDPFWIDGSLRISADKQVEFLRAFHAGGLGLSERSLRLTKQVMVAEENASWNLSAKTGACQPRGGDTSNWYMGYVENGRTVYYFALQIGATNYGRAFSERVPITRAILMELGILT